MLLTFKVVDLNPPGWLLAQTSLCRLSVLEIGGYLLLSKLEFKSILEHIKQRQSAAIESGQLDIG